MQSVQWQAKIMQLKAFILLSIIQQYNSKMEQHAFLILEFRGKKFKLNIWLYFDFLLVQIWIIKWKKKYSFRSFQKGPDFIFPLYFCTWFSTVLFTWVWRNKSRRPRNFAWSVRQVLCHSVISANYRIYISELSLGFLIRGPIDYEIKYYGYRGWQGG